MIKANFKLLNEKAKVPVYVHETDAGADIYATEDMVIPELSDIIVPTGVSWEPEFIFPGMSYSLEQDEDLLVAVQNHVHILKVYYKIFMLLWPRSGLSCKNQIEVGAGLIDESFRGELKVHLYNFSYQRYYISEGDRIAQGIIQIAPKVEICQVDSLKETTRGSGGFGSTGK